MDLSGCGNGRERDKCRLRAKRSRLLGANSYDESGIACELQYDRSGIACSRGACLRSKDAGRMGIMAAIMATMTVSWVMVEQCLTRK